MDTISIKGSTLLITLQRLLPQIIHTIIRRRGITGMLNIYICWNSMSTKN